MIQRISSRVIIQRQDKKCLVIWIEKADGQIVPDLVGGGLLPYETPTNCAVREMEEEIGLIVDPDVLKFLGYGKQIVEIPNASSPEMFDPLEITTMIFYTKINVDKPSLTLQAAEDIIYSTWVDIPTLINLVPYVKKFAKEKQQEEKYILV